MSIPLDYNATSPMHVPVIDAIRSFLQEAKGNQSGLHGYGCEHREIPINGGRREIRRRGGPENAAGIVGLGKATQFAWLEMAHRRLHLAQLRGLFESRLSQIPGNIFFGRQSARRFRE
jgi:cysteine sulfinate desulfinase/cysteine desulfurase-like protein